MIIIPQLIKLTIDNMKRSCQPIWPAEEREFVCEGVQIIVD